MILEPSKIVERHNRLGCQLHKIDIYDNRRIIPSEPRSSLASPATLRRGLNIPRRGRFCKLVHFDHGNFQKCLRAVRRQLFDIHRCNHQGFDSRTHPRLVSHAHIRSPKSLHHLTNYKRSQFPNRRFNIFQFHIYLINHLAQCLLTSR